MVGSTLRRPLEAERSTVRRRQVRRLRFAVLSASALVTSCFVPKPAFYRSIPEVTGLIVDASSPVEGATVWSLTSASSCAAPHSEIFRTATDGSFHIPARRRFRFGVFVTGGDPGQVWTICVRSPDHTEPAPSVAFSWGYEAPAEVEVRCDLALPDPCQQHILR